MFVKLQHLDTNCFHILGSIKTATKTATNVGASVSPLEKLDSIKKHGKKKKVLVECLNGGIKKFGRVYRKAHDRKNDVFHDSRLIQHGLLKDPDGGIIGNHGSSGNKKDGAVKFKEEGRDRLVDKAPAKCSTKGATYGGCIPAILEALETINDLDEAFRPWEEDLNNKEMSMILTEQSNWERALEIFEWFKKKGCYEVNVIHYNIMLRILGKARKWRLVEGMWDEMMDGGITLINSTYGTLINVYSKGGSKQEALHWMELRNKKGMESDEVTMGTVVQMYKKAGDFKKAGQFFMKWSSDTYGKAGQLREASRTFKRILGDGIVPNTVTFNTMIHMWQQWPPRRSGFTDAENGRTWMPI